MTADLSTKVTFATMRPRGIRFIAICCIFFSAFCLITGTYNTVIHGLNYSFLRDSVFGHIPLLVGGICLWLGMSVGWWLVVYTATRILAILGINLIFHFSTIVGYFGFPTTSSSLQSFNAQSFVLYTTAHLLRLALLLYLLRHQVRNFFNVSFPIIKLLAILVPIAITAVLLQRLIQGKI